MFTSSSCLCVNYWSWINWPQYPFTLKSLKFFFGTDENDEKMMTLGNIMQFRNIYTSHFTSHLCTSLDMDHHVVISSLPVTTPFIPASSHPFKTWALRCARVKKFPPTKLHELVSKPVAHVRHSNLQSELYYPLDFGLLQNTTLQTCSCKFSWLLT